MDSMIDRILNGEFDDDSKLDIETQDCLVPDPDDDDEPSVDEGDDEMEDIPNEDDDVEDSTEVDLDRDLPSEDFCLDYMEHNEIEAEPELAMPKNSTFKNPVKETKETKKMEANTKTTPKNSTATPATPATSAPTSSEGAKAKRGRGRPLKLNGANAEEAVRLYNEGVGAKVIGEKFGVSVSCVINCLKANNVSIRPKGRRKGT